MADFDSNILEKDKQELKEPPRYNVVFHNDHYTPFDFVALVLVKIFRKSMVEAMAFADEVHKKGKGIAGTYSSDIARTKAVQSNRLAKDNGFPLKVTVEEA